MNCLVCFIFWPRARGNYTLEDGPLHGEWQLSRSWQTQIQAVDSVMSVLSVVVQENVQEINFYFTVI